MDRIVYPIAEKGYHELLSTAAGIVDQIMQLNEEALIQFKRSKTTETFEEYHKAALFLWTEAIELLDGIKSLILGSSCNVIPILMRSLFEVSISVQFIYSDSQKIKRRALTYLFCLISKRYDTCKKMDINNPDGQEYRKALGPEVVNLYSLNINQTKLNSDFDRFISKKLEYQEIQREYDRKKNGRRSSPEWYELFDECGSIYAMACKVNLKAHYYGCMINIQKKHMDCLLIWHGLKMDLKIHKSPI